MINTPGKSIAVIGAGITGLTAALRLTQRGHRVRLFEAADRVGGAIRSERVNGWLVEAGPNSLLAGDPAVTALTDQLELTPERLTANRAARNRYIVRQGKLIAVPLSPPALLRSHLFSAGAKLRIVSELLRRPAARNDDVSLEEFTRDHFGQEIVDYAFEPLCQRRLRRRSPALSTRHAFPKLWEAERNHGSLLRSQIATAQTAKGNASAGIISFRDGLQTLPETIASRLPAGTLTLRSRIDALVPQANGSWLVEWQDETSVQKAGFDFVIAAVPAPALARLQFGVTRDRLLAELDDIAHPPVSSVFLGYHREEVAHPLDGFGVLVPEVEHRSILGFSSLRRCSRIARRRGTLRSPSWWAARATLHWRVFPRPSSS